jgi:hypothetical protein
MSYGEIIAVCSKIHTKHINTLCRLNVEVVNVKPGGTYSDQRDLEGEDVSVRTPKTAVLDKVNGVFTGITNAF